jgi:glucans biosynthesis protein
VELFEMPAIHEGHDNIACYWVPADKPRALEPLALDYDVHFFAQSQPNGLKSLATARGTEITRRDDGLLEFEITFLRPSAQSPTDDNAGSLPEIDVSSIRGEVIEQSVTKSDAEAWNVRLLVRPVTEKDPVELKLTLRRSGTALSETWSYLAAQKAPPYQYPQVYTRQD